MEYEGKSWDSWLKSAQNKLQTLTEELESETRDSKKKLVEQNIKNIKRRINSTSRLFPIDAGLDPSALRQKYPDGSKFMITKGVVDLRYNYFRNRARDPFLWGWVKKISVDEINVPSDMRDFFLDLKKGEDGARSLYSSGSYLAKGEPRYQVTLKYGKRYEPWIARAKLLMGKDPAKQG